MFRSLRCLALALGLLACSDDTTDNDTDGAGGDVGGGGAPAGSGGGGGATEASSSTVGAGGAPIDRCPEVCAKMEALFMSFNCPLDECNCKAPCADLLEVSLDCIPPGSSDCTCNSNGELDCTICDGETAAANECWQAN